MSKTNWPEPIKNKGHLWTADEVRPAPLVHRPYVIKGYTLISELPLIVLCLVIVLIMVAWGILVSGAATR